MQDSEAIPDEHITASSERDEFLLAKYGRLNNVYQESVKYVHAWNKQIFEQCDSVGGKLFVSTSFF
jgi:hypothetical protein